MCNVGKKKKKGKKSWFKNNENYLHMHTLIYMAVREAGQFLSAGRNFLGEK